MIEHDTQSRKDFEARYEASIVPSDRRYRRLRRPTYTEIQNWYVNDQSITSAYAYSDRVEDVDMIEVLMPADKLRDLLESQETYLYNRDREERLLREQYKSLQNVWEQYQVVLALVRG